MISVLGLLKLNVSLYSSALFSCICCAGEELHCCSSILFSEKMGIHIC